jgi:hypothetical protein
MAELLKQLNSHRPLVSIWLKPIIVVIIKILGLLICILSYRFFWRWISSSLKSSSFQTLMVYPIMNTSHCGSQTSYLTHYFDKLCIH